MITWNTVYTKMIFSLRFCHMIQIKWYKRDLIMLHFIFIHLGSEFASVEFLGYHLPRADLAKGRCVQLHFESQALMADYKGCLF